MRSRGFGVAITDPSRVAAAAPIRGAAATTNAGSGTISPGEVLDATNAQLLTTANIVFTSRDAVHRQRRSRADLHGRRQHRRQRLARADQRRAGDRRHLHGAQQRGRHRRQPQRARARPTRLRAGVLDGGTISVAGAVERLTADVGLQTRTAQVNRDAEAVVNADDLAARDSVSGVNLDEEAANMLRYQQAYQAAAQIIAMASSLFDSLLNAVRR